jgi:hypothetical protein
MGPYTRPIFAEQVESTATGYLIGAGAVEQMIWLPICNSLRTRPGWVEPEIYFRIVHLAQNAISGARTAIYEQTVEISFGPKGAFESGNIGAMTRRLATDRVVSAVLPPRGKPKPSKVAKTPRVVELLRKAIEWQVLLESGEIVNRADIARQEGITRARVTQVMGMLRLAPEIREKILSTPNAVRRPLVTERVLRPIATITDYHNQIREFHKLLG